MSAEKSAEAPRTPERGTEAWLLTKSCIKCGAPLEPPVTAYHRKGMFRCRPCHTRISRQWAEAHPEETKARGRAKQQRMDADPAELKKKRARRRLHHAIEKGRILRGPCGSCGTPDAQGHHDDYDKPLKVRWLCPRCHVAEHRAEAS